MLCEAFIIDVETSQRNLVKELYAFVEKLQLFLEVWIGVRLISFFKIVDGREDGI